MLSVSVLVCSSSVCVTLSPPLLSLIWQAHPFNAIGSVEGVRCCDIEWTMQMNVKGQTATHVRQQHQQARAGASPVTTGLRGETRGRSTWSDPARELEAIG